ncbi:coiled-coil domain-containing protein 149-like protein [Leptotrombidium deliense]|uniref:Coiled-coil domain-containing protein 149-like protein n=1 Tax=Leptotrombidium deliense TaxID=299467 RepID=A0A443SCL8_9ACAR|nr:coiled-coil domain-containing protein 149-like protein [Leptotrombidium deliense]
MSAKNAKITNEFMNEISVLRCKLDTKCKALMILSQDLMECKRERDEFKLMAEQLRERHSVLKRRMEALGPSLCDVNGKNSFPTDNAAFAQIVCELRQQNKSLLFDVEELRMKLSDAEGDVKLLREQNNSLRAKVAEVSKRYYCDSPPLTPSKSNCELMSDIEVFKNKCEQLENDLKAVLDEKEELVVSRDAYKAKVERLNERLNDFLRLSPVEDKKSVKIIDIDSLITENNFLREKIAQLEEERNNVNKTLVRYKSMLEKGNLRKNSFIASNNLNDLRLTEHNLTHLKSLVIALFEALSDKSSAFALQKKNNKLLGNRIQELEEKLKTKETVQMLAKESSVNFDIFEDDISDECSTENTNSETL